jgi:hypothetical protein
MAAENRVFWWPVFGVLSTGTSTREPRHFKLFLSLAPSLDVFSSSHAGTAGKN